jgi:hypothetical protein
LLASASTVARGLTLDTHRRRIDTISDPGFVTHVADLDLAELRSRREMCTDLDGELSYHRRLLHGRLDLLAFERRRRTGGEERTLAEALPEILGDRPPAPGSGHVTVTGTRTDPPSLPSAGRRDIDFVLGDDFLGRLPDMSDTDLADIEERLRDAEREVSQHRATVHHAEDVLGEELRRRYREGLASVDELLPG